MLCHKFFFWIKQIQEPFLFICWPCICEVIRLVVQRRLLELLFPKIGVLMLFLGDSSYQVVLLNSDFLLRGEDQRVLGVWELVA